MFKIQLHKLTYIVKVFLNILAEIYFGHGVSESQEQFNTENQTQQNGNNKEFILKGAFVTQCK